MKTDNAFKISRMYKVMSVAFLLSLAAASCDMGTTSENNADNNTTSENYKEPVNKTDSVKIDSVELAKMQKAYDQGWTEKDLEKNKKMYTKSSHYASFLNEIIAVDDDACSILVKDFETGKMRIVNAHRFAVGNMHNIYHYGRIRYGDQLSVFFHPGDIVRIPVEARAIPRNYVYRSKWHPLPSYKILAQEYYDNNDILFNGDVGNNSFYRVHASDHGAFIVIEFNMDICNKRREYHEYPEICAQRQAQRQADSAKFHRLKQMADSLCQSR